MALFGDLLLDSIAVVIALAVIVFTYFQWKFQTWKRKGLNYFEPSFPFGNLEGPFAPTINRNVTFWNLYKTAKKNGWKHFGCYGPAEPIYMPVDLDLVKNILAKDFDHFADRGLYVNEKSDPLRAHLVTLSGNKWRNLRTKITPTFTSGKMKLMLPIMVECQSTLRHLLNREIEKGGPIDIKEILACFTTDIIGSCAFGLDFNAVRQEESPFRKYGRRIFGERSLLMMLKMMMFASFPKLALALRLKFTPKPIEDFFMGVVKKTVEYRETSNFSRDDFMQLMIQLKNKEGDEALTIEEIAAQCFVFFLAGFETSSTLMSFALYELAKNQDIQDKVRQEIKQVLLRHGGAITYESIQEMKYLSQVLDESLRKYPPVPTLPRRCVKDYKVPGEDLVIEKGSRVLISVLGIHRDEEYYPDPDKFDPERFTEEAKQARHHFSFLPFGEGPRVCIGLRFGLLQAKVGLTSLLKDYSFTVNTKTQEPLTLAIKTALAAAEGDIWVNAKQL